MLTMDMGLYRSERIRRKFSDGKSQPPERMIEPMIESLATYAVSQKAGRIRRERERLEAAEREKRRQEAQRRVDLDNKRYEFFLPRQSAWTVLLEWKRVNTRQLLKEGDGLSTPRIQSCSRRRSSDQVRRLAIQNHREALQNILTIGRLPPFDPGNLAFRNVPACSLLQAILNLG